MFISDFKFDSLDQITSVKHYKFSFTTLLYRFLWKPRVGFFRRNLNDRFIPLFTFVINRLGVTNTYYLDINYKKRSTRIRVKTKDFQYAPKPFSIDMCEEPSLLFLLRSLGEN